MKKIVSLVLALMMIFSVCSPAIAASYKDLVKENAKYVSAVDALTELKVIEGFPDGTFRAEECVTRAQLAKMLVLCSGLDDQAKALNATTIFSDVDSAHWASGYIAVAAQSKLIVGYPDGTFKPEQEVSYAEAFTMCLRALGYGNVVEAEGTWPTAYVLKAVELGLNDDMEDVVSNKSATRGNIAILLWNMLRTEMWRISAESEKNGMTKTNTGDFMLNVKFPDYTYVEDGIITSIDVIDYENVTLTLDGEITAKVNNVDLVHLIEGQKVCALIKEGKKEDIILTLTPSNAIISGFTEDKNEDKLKIDGKEYRLEEDIEINVDDYVVVEIEGKKITAIKILPTEGIFVETISRMESRIDEDALVIKDGKWTTRDDIKVGDVYTEIDNYYVVSSTTYEGEFEVVYTDTIKWDGSKVDLTYLSIDRGDYRLAGDSIVAKKDKDNKTDIPMADLKVKVRDNEYTGKDVVVYFNYLDIPVRLEFGEITSTAVNNSFYAIVSNGAWSNGGSKGKTYNIGMVGIDGEEKEFRTVVNADIPEILTSNKDYYKNNPDERGLFAWADINDEDEIEALVILEDGLQPESGSYKSKYTIAAVDADSKVNGKKVLISGEEYNMTSSTIIFEARAHKNDNDEIDGFNVYVSNDYKEYDDVILPEGTLAALDSKNKVKLLFITNEAESNEVFYGIAEKGSNYSKDVIKLDGKEYEITKDSIEFFTGDVIRYSFVNNKVKVKEIFDVKILDDSILFIVDEVDEDAILSTSAGEPLSLDEDDVDYKDHKKYKVYELDYKLDDENIEIIGLELQKILGHKGLNVDKYDRILILDNDKVMFVLSDLDEDEVVINGTIVLGE